MMNIEQYKLRIKLHEFQIHDLNHVTQNIEEFQPSYRKKIPIKKTIIVKKTTFFLFSTSIYIQNFLIKNLKIRKKPIKHHNPFI